LSGRFANLLARTRFSDVFEHHPLVSIDIGSRFGLEPDLEPIAFAVNAYGFEPDPVECARLQEIHSKNPAPWRSIRYMPAAVSGSGGPRTLHVPESLVSASLLEHDEEVGKRFQNPDMFDRKQTIHLDTITLTEACQGFDVDRPRYLKVDIEGAELEVLRGAPGLLQHLVALKTEVAFIPMRKSQPLASDVDTFLHHAGFRIMDWVNAHHWRIGHSVAHPQISPGPIPYSRGQLAQCDFIYLRDPDQIFSGPDAVDRGVAALALSMAQGYFDYAASLLSRSGLGDYIAREYRFDPLTALREASLMYGTLIWRDAFVNHLRRIVTFGRSGWRLTRRGALKPT
jgi:FkbM family methyltransferase